MTKILVVDDSSSMRQMITFTLQAAGYQVVDAEDGSAGLNAAKNDSFDLILTDVNMPVMNGFEFAKNVRMLPNYKFTPILMLTTESATDKKIQGKQAGVTGWIVKPFKPEIIISTIKRLL